MLPTDIDIETCFQLDNNPADIQITDNTDYAGNSIDPNDVLGVLRITGPTGAVIYNNNNFASPDLDLSSSAVFTVPNPLPVDTDDEVLTGTYVVMYSIQIDGITEYTKTFTYTYGYTQPEVCIQLEADCATSKLTSTDATNYGESGTSAFTVTRTHTINPPYGATGYSPTTEDLASHFVSPITTKTWTTTLTSDVKFTFDDGLCVTDQLTGQEEIEVICDQNLCDIFCCVDKLNSRYRKYRSSRPREAQKIKEEQLDIVMQSIILFKMARDCGQKKRAQALYNDILEIAECDAGCSCDSEDPIEVIPITIVQGPAGPTGPQGPAGADGVDHITYAIDYSWPGASTGNWTTVVTVAQLTTALLNPRELTYTIYEKETTGGGTYPDILNDIAINGLAEGTLGGVRVDENGNFQILITGSGDKSLRVVIQG